MGHGANSPMFYEQLLHPDIPKAQKGTSDLTVFFLLLVFLRVKAAHKGFGYFDHRFLNRFGISGVINLFVLWFGLAFLVQSV